MNSATFNRALAAFLLLVSLAPVEANGAWRDPAVGSRGMVVSAHSDATAAGQAMLAAGGNAMDAAAAVSFALSVVEPFSSGIGGGGFMVLRMGEATTTLDFREVAPASATRDMFVEDGHVVKGRSTRTALAAGIPGQVRGIVLAHGRFGRLSLAAVMGPAIRLAAKGFKVTPRLHGAIGQSAGHFNAAARRVFLTRSGQVPAVGSTLRQRDLAKTLRSIARSAGESFYTGPVARAMVRAVRDAGGLWAEEDLAGYRVRERDPVRGEYRGYEVLSMGPPSSGGLLLVQMLSVLEAFDLGALGPGSERTVHLMVEAMKRAFAMRATGLGDPDQNEVRWADFTGSEVVSRLREAVGGASRATPPEALSSMKVRAQERTHTSHFAVMTANGDAVATTQTINLRFGSGLVAGATGVVLNNEMDDFSTLPGAPNAFGLVGSEANAVAPGRRPLSSMTPALVVKDGVVAGAFGSPGGSTIITTTLQMILNVVDHGMDAGEAVGAPRVHHQWYPDEVRVEAFGLSPDTRRGLEARGHGVRVRADIGNGMALWRRPDGILTGAADPRGEGTAQGW